MKVSIIATNNLPNRNMGRFPAAELPAIAKKLVGVAAIVDHEAEYEEQWGTVVEARVERAEPTPEQLEAYPDVLRTEGLQNVVAVVQSKTQIEIVPDVGDHASITTAYTDLVCPGCTCEYRDADRCKKAWEALSTLGYLERAGVQDIYEISLVAVPAVPDAIVTNVEP
jgi:hypothetical protein